MTFRISILAGVVALAGAASIGAAQTFREGASAAPADDPRYQRFYDRALDALQARDRIPFVEMRPDGLYNFWQDQTNVRGLLRRTRMASYRTAEPVWEPVLDIDALAKADGK